MGDGDETFYDIDPPKKGNDKIQDLQILLTTKKCKEDATEFHKCLLLQMSGIAQINTN